ncbi:MAG: hypothetical protein IJ846_02610 [Alphaproteobacteria bacterium]|nr:hypothetical protein [Alphaproteobacteria bacterium]
MKQPEWKIRLKIDPEQDAALIIMNEAQKHSSFSPFELMTYRLAVHEAVLNALKYGGGEAVLTAFGNAGKMQVEIRQKNKIIWPNLVRPFRGVALIKRYAQTEISDNSRTLILRFLKYF